jgi:hypothetical protein
LKNTDTHLSSSGELIKINFLNEKGEACQELLFDKIFTTGIGQLLGVDIHPKEILNDSVFSTVSTINREYDTLHKVLRHPSDQIVKQTSKIYGIKVNGPTHPCKYCAQGKHKKTMIPKLSTNKATSIGERINIDISYVNTTSFGGYKYWLMVQDSYTDYLWSFFLKQKSETSDTILGWVTRIRKEQGIVIKNIRCDNSGENKKLRDDCKDHK